jgi:hypothetical protein
MSNQLTRLYLPFLPGYIVKTTTITVLFTTPVSLADRFAAAGNPAYAYSVSTETWNFLGWFSRFDGIKSFPGSDSQAIDWPDDDDG